MIWYICSLKKKNLDLPVTETLLHILNTMPCLQIFWDAILNVFITVYIHTNTQTSHLNVCMVRNDAVLTQYEKTFNNNKNVIIITFNNKNIYY